MSLLEIIVLVLVVVIVLAFVGGLLGVRARDRRRASVFSANVAEADTALEQARASDRGWDRPAMEAACRVALREQAPDYAFDTLHLVLVEDRPGKEEDRAHFVARGPEGERRVVLARSGDRWGPESSE
jgi:type II secretory pathway pseudopilin PulG